MPVSELTSAVDKGIAELGEMPEFSTEESSADDNLEIQDGKVVKKESPKAPQPAAETGGPPEGDEIEEEELTEEQLKNAKIIFKSLNNPKTAKSSLQFLASNLGFDLPTATPTTKAEAKEQARDIVEEMKEAAPGLEFLIDKIGPIIKQHLEAQVAEVRGEVEADRTERANEVLKTESAKAFTTVATKFNYPDGLIPKPILAEMTSLMGKIQPTADLKLIEYITTLHDAARGKLVLIEPPKKETSPLRKLASERVSPKAASALPTKMSLNQAIAAAAEELSQK